MAPDPFCQPTVYSDAAICGQAALAVQTSEERVMEVRNRSEPFKRHFFQSWDKPEHPERQPRDSSPVYLRKNRIYGFKVVFLPTSIGDNWIKVKADAVAVVLRPGCCLYAFIQACGTQLFCSAHAQ